MVRVPTLRSIEFGRGVTVLTEPVFQAFREKHRPAANYSAVDLAWSAGCAKSQVHVLRGPVISVTVVGYTEEIKSQGQKMKQKFEVFSEKYDSNMMDTWTVYLLLVQHLDGTFEIGGAQYEILGTASDYSDEDGEILLSQEIDGKSVFGVEGDYVVGGELSLELSQYSTLRFTDFCREDIVDYLASEGWEEGLVTVIERAFKSSFKPAPSAVASRGRPSQ
jgi:hypothetical protein